MYLPPTHYDYLRRARPYLLELAEKDAANYASSLSSLTSVGTIDNIDNHLEECLHTGFMRGFQPELRSHLSLEDAIELLQDAPTEQRHRLANFLGGMGIEYHCIFNFALSGKKTFHFSRNLTEHLLNTEINLNCRFIELPFPCCMFVYTSPSAIDALHEALNGFGNFEPSSREARDYSAPISVFVTLLDATSGLSGRSIIFTAFQARRSDRGHAMTKRQMFLPDDWSLEMALRTEWDTLYADGKECVVETRPGRPSDEGFYTDGLRFFRMLINSVLYLSAGRDLTERPSRRSELIAEAASLQKSKKRRKLQSANSFSELAYSDVGCDLPPIVISSAHHDDTEPRVVSGLHSNSLQTRVMVRGHWRHQPHGTGLSQRKLIWIKPFLKGPDIAELVNKAYHVR